MDERRELADNLGLYAHSEGAMFKEMTKADRQIQVTNQTTGHEGPRMLVSSIYLMLEGPNILSWHKILSDEIIFWHKGSALKIHLISPEGAYMSKILGDPLVTPEAAFQQHLPHDYCYAAELLDPSGFVLYSEIVAPAFEMSDYIKCSIEDMEKLCPEQKALVKRLHKE